MPSGQRQGTASALSFETDGIDVIATQLTADTEDLRDFTSRLSGPERERAARFVFDRDRRRFIIARARLRQLLAQRLGMEPESIELVYGARGKPAIARRPTDPDLRFNVSHCDDVAIYAFSYGRDVGVDIERVRILPDADQIAARFFSCREHETYRALASHDRPLGFFNCWTRKEAFIKALGDGLAHPLHEFDVSLTPGVPAEILRVGTTPGDRCGWRMDSFSLGSAFVAAVVSAKDCAY